MTDAAWPSSPLVEVTDLHGRDVPYPYYKTEWTSEDEFAYPAEVDSITFDVVLVHDGTPDPEAEFRVGVDLVDEDDNTVQEVHPLAKHYVAHGGSETLTLAVAVAPTQALTRFKVTVQVLADKSVTGTENWYDPEFRIYSALYVPVEDIARRCPIGTAAYGSVLALPVQFLREVRDDQLLESRFRSTVARFLDRYYVLSSPIVGAMDRNRRFRNLMKYAVVWPVVIIAVPIAYVVREADLGSRRQAPKR